jgi:CRP-like cAMP-binding protein
VSDASARFPSAFKAMPAPLVEALKPHASVIRAGAGRILISPDARSTEVYWVAHGRIQVALISAAGREVILRDMGEGEVFGEMAPIDRQARSATIMALEDCMLISAPGPIFRQVVFAHPDSAEWLARILIQRVRDLTAKVFELNALRVPGRLHCELLRLCGDQVRDREPAVIDPSPTHAELAARIGTHREAVTREIGLLVEQRIVHQGRRRLTVLDVPELARLVRLAAGGRGGDPGLAAG